MFDKKDANHLVEYIANVLFRPHTGVKWALAFYTFNFVYSKPPPEQPTTTIFIL